MQKKIPFRTKSEDFKNLAYNDCVYAWLLVHSYNDGSEYHNYIYKNDFTFLQIGKDIHRSNKTVSKRFKELLGEIDEETGEVIKPAFLVEKKIGGRTAYILPYTNPFQYLHGKTVIKLLNLPLKDQKEELIKTLAYLLEKKKMAISEGRKSFEVSSSEILKEFNHSIGHASAYERIRLNLTVLQGAGIIKFKTEPYNDINGMPPLMHVYWVSKEGRASDEWLGVSNDLIPEQD